MQVRDVDFVKGMQSYEQSSMRAFFVKGRGCGDNCKQEYFDSCPGHASSHLPMLLFAWIPGQLRNMTDTFALPAEDTFLMRFEELTRSSQAFDNIVETKLPAESSDQNHPELQSCMRSVRPSPRSSSAQFPSAG